MIGKFIKYHKARLHKSNKQLSVMASISPSYLYQLENGFKDNISLEMFMNLSRIFLSDDEIIRRVLEGEEYDGDKTDN